jgi:AcrR family transcriptional regulator
MKTRQVPVISVRKQPRQARSERLVTYILEAAVRVLAREGAQKFTTARVAEAAGVSVGSLYQYFPNKESILFRLQTDEWDQTSALLGNILVNSDEPPPDRLRSMVCAFFKSEWEEASLRTALGDAAPLYRDAPEARKHKKIVTRQALTFMKAALPEVPANERAFAAAVVMTIMSVIGKRVSGEARSKSEVEAWALAIGEMLCAYLQRLAERRKSQCSGQFKLR